MARDEARVSEPSMGAFENLRPAPADARTLEDAVALHRAGRNGEALRLYRRVLAAEPDRVDALNLGGVALVQSGALDEALEFLERAAGAAPERADVQYNLGRALAELRRFGESAAAFRRAIGLAPNDAQAHNNLGLVLAQLGEPDRAETAFRQALALKSGYAEAHNNLGALLLDGGRLDEALIAIRRAIEIAPGYAGAHNNLGRVLRDTGEIDEATAAFRRAIEIAPDHVEAYGNFYGLKILAPVEPDIAAMRLLLSRPTLSERHAIVLCFALARAYEGLGEYDQSFEFLKRGNRMKLPTMDYDRAAREAKVGRIVAVFDRDLLARAQGHGCPSRVPIFVVGMPRSGTTLVEQILASHSQVRGGGELADLPTVVDGLEKRSASRGGYPDVVSELGADELRAIGEAYIAAARQHAGEGPRLTDKLPANFLHIGLIHLILPNAKIVHCKRDPIDTCSSCYKLQEQLCLGWCAVRVRPW